MIIAMAEIIGSTNRAFPDASGFELNLRKIMLPRNIPARITVVIKGNIYTDEPKTRPPSLFHRICTSIDTMPDTKSSIHGPQSFPFSRRGCLLFLNDFLIARKISENRGKSRLLKNDAAIRKRQKFNAAARNIDLLYPSAGSIANPEMKHPEHAPIVFIAYSVGTFTGSSFFFL